MKKLVIGFCPTRRDCFSKLEAQRFRKMIQESVEKKHDVELVDLKGLNEEELLCRREDVEAVIARYVTAGVDALFFPHCNFGSEGLVALVARAIAKPVLIWGPRDDTPDAEGIRSRDSQCGMFAVGKVLRRHKVPFTYLTNSAIDSDEFHEGFEKFLAVARTVKAVKNLRILQISTRPEAFSSVICNEGELLEKFNVHVYPVALTDITVEMKKVKSEKGEEFEKTVEYIKSLNPVTDAEKAQERIEAVAAMKVAMKNVAKTYLCNAIAIQCWSALQVETDIMPCFVNALLTQEGLPTVCETDIHGAIGAVMMQAATQEVPFFADITIRHPQDDNAELLWHCGNFPPCLTGDKSTLSVCGNPYMDGKNFGIIQNKLKDGNLTIARFDGDNGQYSLLIGEAITTEGPHNKGSYVWIKTSNWAKWEHKLVEGPYIHHVSGAYGNVGEILMEACKYLPGLTPDPVEPSLDELTQRWW